MNEIEEMIHELAYARVKNSPLWHSLPSNEAIDAKAEELAGALQHFIDYWFESEPVQFPVEAPALRSLAEVQSQRDEEAA
jgi:hypothetical protein